MNQNDTTTHNGFILPSVLLVGLAVMIIGLSLIQTSTSVRASIDNAYYDRIASEAGEAGTSYATYCLKKNNYVQTWGPRAGRPNLTQSTDCTGAPIAQPIKSLSVAGGLNSSFSIGNVSRGSDGTYVINAASTVNLLTAGNDVVKTYTTNSLKAVGADAIRFGTVTYGYYQNNNQTNTEGAFYAIRGSDGKYRTSGSNDVGQFGNGTTNNALVPQTYNLPGGMIAMTAYSNFLSQGYGLFVITNNQEVYGAGLGSSGQLGNGKTDKINSTPQKFVLPAGEKAVQVAPKGDSVFVLTESHNLYAAGSCDNGELGINNSSCTNISTPTRVLLPPVNDNDLNTQPSSNIVSDASSVFVRMLGGRVYGWGRNQFGELATGAFNSKSDYPIQIGTFGNPGQPTAQQVAFDGDTVYVLDSNGDVWASGRNHYGQMGFPPSTSQYATLQKVPVPSSAGKVTQVATDQWTVMYLTTSGQVWGAGTNRSGEIGNGKTSQFTNQLEQFIIPSGRYAKYIYNAATGVSSKSNNTFAILDDGTVIGSGGNSFGQLGAGYNSQYESTPVQMQVFDGNNVKAGDVITGLGSTIILTTDKIYYTVGNNKFGQLGNGTSDNSNVPAAAEYLRIIPAYIF